MSARSALECGGLPPLSFRFGDEGPKSGSKLPHSKAALCAALVLMFIAACAPRAMNRDRWEQAPPAERLLYVKALLGAEEAKQAKGGNPKKFTRPASAYVEVIDHAYASGDERTADQIFESLADPRQ